MSFNGDLYPSNASVVMTTKGDMVDFDTARQRLGIGSANQILQVKSGLPSWETLSTAGSVLTTQGDILYESASGLARLGFGTSGDVLTTKGTGANPAWETAGGTTVTTQSASFSTPQTTTSTGLTDITGSTITLPTRTGGFAFISAQLTVENTVSTSATQIGTYKNSADSIQSCNEQNAVNTSNTINVSDSDDLDGGALKARWAVQSGTSTLNQSAGSGKSLMRTFEVS